VGAAEGEVPTTALPLAADPAQVPAWQRVTKAAKQAQRPAMARASQSGKAGRVDTSNATGTNMVASRSMSTATATGAVECGYGITAPTTAGGCGWLRHRALVTGSPYWWHRYHECLG
jgi:hypothetical protein